MERKRKILPPVYLLLALLAMAGLHLWWPLARFIEPPYSYLGAVLILLGVVLAALAARLFAQADTAIVPFEPSTALVVTGIYRYTRNPMYLGMLMVLFGAWLLFGSASGVLPIVAFASIIRFNFIRGEERFLEQIFGEAYLSYKRRARRWI